MPLSVSMLLPLQSLGSKVSSVETPSMVVTSAIASRPPPGSRWRDSTSRAIRFVCATAGASRSSSGGRSAAIAVPEIARQEASAASTERARTVMTTRRPPLDAASGATARLVWVE